jgi:cell division protein FtsI (penicillin-binding protein 3)
MANDGVYVAPRITAATIQPQSTPQTIAFHPVNERRVISSFTAAEMRQMMQGVVLHGTGKKAKLLGYSSAGKTGTAQKVDPATRAYSRTKYVATFAGFAPINNPAITVVVVLDSAVGLHQGGQVSAPVFTRIAQQVLEYMHTPHDLELPPNRQVLLAQAKAPDKDLEEGSPDHPGEAIDATEANAADTTVPDRQLMAANMAKPSAGSRAPAPVPDDRGTQNGGQNGGNGAIVPAALRQQERAAQPNAKNILPVAENAAAPGVPAPANGTVVLDVEQGGIVVPSFAGMSVRSAIELAESSGLDLDVVGSGRGQDQSPPAGARVPGSTRIKVKFGR